VLNVYRNHKVIRDGEKGEGGVWRWEKREIIYLSLQCHHHNDSCIKMGSSDDSHFNVSLIVRDKVTRQCPLTTTFEEKGQPNRIRTEVPLLTSLTPFARPNWLPSFTTVCNIISLFYSILSFCLMSSGAKEHIRDNL